MAQTLLDLITPRPIDDWHEDIGDVIWWKFPVNEPPYVGTPLDSEWDDHDYDYTHWTPLPIVWDKHGNIRCPKSETGEHQWGIDGQHSNEYCKLCFIPKPHGLPPEEDEEVCRLCGNPPGPGGCDGYCDCPS